MEPADMTLEIFKSVRDEVSSVRVEVCATNDRLDATNRRLDGSNARLDAVREQLSARIAESDIRTAAAITALHGTVRDLLDVLLAQHDLRPRMDRCERDLGEIKNRLGL
jgi:hypothetical protein